MRIGFYYGGLRVWAVICLIAMLIGPIGTAQLPKAVFGLFERFSTFSAVVFNAVLGVCLMRGQFEKQKVLERAGDYWSDISLQNPSIGMKDTVE